MSKLFINIIYILYVNIFYLKNKFYYYLNKLTGKIKLIQYLNIFNYLI